MHTAPCSFISISAEDKVSGYYGAILPWSVIAAGLSRHLRCPAPLIASRVRCSDSSMYNRRTCSKKKKHKRFEMMRESCKSFHSCTHEPHAMHSWPISFLTPPLIDRHNPMTASETTSKPSEVMQYRRPCSPPNSVYLKLCNRQFPFQNSQSSSTDLIAQSNFSRSVLEKNFSIGTSNFLEKTTVRRGSM